MGHYGGMVPSHVFQYGNDAAGGMGDKMPYDNNGNFASSMNNAGGGINLTEGPGAAAAVASFHHYSQAAPQLVPHNHHSLVDMGGRQPLVLEESRQHHQQHSQQQQLSINQALDRAGRGITDGGGTCVHDQEVTVTDPWGRELTPEVYSTFDIPSFPPRLRDELMRAGFPAPSQIQAYTWPLGLQGRDMIGIAATGSGKTLAFLLPAFVDMHSKNWDARRNGCGLLVMAPTRELAQQTEKEAERFGACLNMRTVSMYGGAPKRDQMYKYRSGCHIIVACPGRLNDFLETGAVSLNNVSKLVLDEADRMLDMGFEPQIRRVLERIPRQRHTLFFTATWPTEVRKLASEILYEPYKVMIGNRDVLKGNQDVIQQVRLLGSYDKFHALSDLMREAGLNRRESVGKCLVFASTKKLAEQLNNHLYREGVPCASIHGDKDQYQRENALNGLKNGRLKVLVATDVAARGLDIKGVGMVVNFDPANNTEDYVHRIGRTGRAGAKGYAITFLNNEEASKARGIVEVMDRTNQEVPSELRELVRRNGGSGNDRRRWYGGGGNNRSHHGGRGGHGGGGGYSNGGWKSSSNNYGSNGGGCQGRIRWQQQPASSWR